VQPWRCGRSRPPPAIWARAWQLAADLARAEADKHRASAAPRLDLVAQAEQQRLSGSGDYGSGARNRQTNALLGVQFTVPLYTGGWRSAKEEESLGATTKPRRSWTPRANRRAPGAAAWLGLQAGTEQVRALQQARLPATPGQDATRSGYEVGQRTLSTCCTPTTTALPPRWPWPRRAAGLSSTGCSWRSWPVSSMPLHWAQANQALAPITTPKTIAACAYLYCLTR
jgi:hypothetical protein